MTREFLPNENHTNEVHIEVGMKRGVQRVITGAEIEQRIRASVKHPHRALPPGAQYIGHDRPDKKAAQRRLKQMERKALKDAKRSVTVAES